MRPRSLATLLLLTLTGVAWAEEPVVVNGAGDPARDVPAVQAAVDRGGAVVLKGMFDFGERGRVTIRRSVSVSGDAGASVRDPRGNTIKGGFWTFFSPLPDRLPPEQPGPQISIQGLRFEGALWAPINIAHASRVRIVGNRVTNVRPHPGQLKGSGTSITSRASLSARISRTRRGRTGTTCRASSPGR